MKKHLISLLVLFLMVSTSLVGVSFPITSLGSGNHSPILIIGNDQFTEENGVTGGNGTKDDPYIIENWVIVSDGTASQGIFINNTDMYFIIRNCTIRGFQHPTDYRQGITLSEVTNGVIQDTKVIESATGIELRYSAENKIQNCTCSDCYDDASGYGIYIFHSINTTIVCCKCYNMRDGIYASESSRIILQKTACYDNLDAGLISLEVPATYFIIEDSTFYNNGWSGIDLSGVSAPYPSGTIIRNCSFYSNGLEPVEGLYYNGLSVRRVRNTTIENCTFQQNGCGFALWDKVKNIIIRNCSFLYNVKEGLVVSGEFLFPTFAPHTEISYCDFIGNKWSGLFLYATRGSLVHHCRFMNNSRDGVVVAFCSAQITSNNFVNNGKEYIDENGSCGAGLWASSTDIRDNYWGNPEGPSVSLWVRSKNHTAKLIPLRVIDDSDTLIFQGLYGRCLSRFRPWLSEPVPDAGRQT
jgi:parallel beta-helix repeat protein